MRGMVKLTPEVMKLALSMRARRDSIRGAYDAAMTDHQSRKHWAGADALGPDTANSVGVRFILRGRARYETANNSYLKGMILTRANWVVGTEPRLKLQTKDKEANRRIERAFATWFRAINGGAKLRTMDMAGATDGEVFAQKVTNPRIRNPVMLDMRLMEADMVSTPHSQLDSPRTVDGIEFDEDWNPECYWVQDEHPGEAMGPARHRKVPARDVIHLFRSDRPGQSRGVPEITPALPLFVQMRSYTLSVIAAAEAAANASGVIHKDSDAAEAGDDADTATAGDLFELERNSLLTLPPGWNMNQLKAEQPATTYEMFKREILNEICRCLNMPFNIAAGNSSSYNYASGRLDHQTFQKALRVRRAEIERIVLDDLFASWLAEAALAIPGLVPAELRDAMDVPHAWFWDGDEHVDPAKEANARDTDLRNGSGSLTKICARAGIDVEDHLDELEYEMNERKRRGLPPLASPAEVRVEKVEPEPEEEPARAA